MEITNANPECARPYICGNVGNIGNVVNIANAEDAPSYTDNNYNMNNNLNNNGNQYYGFNPELVCMQYQYYVAISTLIMICFATFICMTVIILNKIKDHQTLVHVRI